MADGLLLDLTRPGYAGCSVAIEQDPDRPGRVWLRIDCDDPHYNGEAVLTADQLDTLLALVAGAHDAGHGDGDGGREGEPVQPVGPGH